MTVQQMLDIQYYLKLSRPELQAGSHDWWDAIRVIANLSNVTFSGDAEAFVYRNKNDVFSLIHAETTRHDDELELAMVQHEAAIRLENTYHKKRIAELDRIMSMLNEGV